MWNWNGPPWFFGSYTQPHTHRASGGRKTVPAKSRANTAARSRPAASPHRSWLSRSLYQLDAGFFYRQRLDADWCWVARCMGESMDSPIRLFRRKLLYSKVNFVELFFFGFFHFFWLWHVLFGVSQPIFFVAKRLSSFTKYFCFSCFIDNKRRRRRTPKSFVNRVNEAIQNGQGRLLGDRLTRRRARKENTEGQGAVERMNSLMGI